jgi:leader peptidase (prepilin peptidase)/N-methyltransferase
LDSLADGAFGLCFGSGLLFWVATIGELAFKREAIGMGDISLMGAIGAFLGWKGCLFAIFGGCFLSVAIALPVLLVAKLFRCENFRLRRGMEIPFAPFLAVGAIAYSLFGQRLLSTFAVAR